MKKSLVSCALFVLIMPCAFAANDIAIIDAGSSGSRLYFYQDVSNGNAPLPTLKLLSSKKVKPGLSSYASNPAAAAASIASLVDFNNLPADEKHADFYLMATAGMRLVLPGQQKAIYSAIQKQLSTTTLNVKFVGTIPGQKEGLYDWIALNYLNHSLIPNATAGVLDMGGASTEIAYATSQVTGTELVRLGDENFHVMSKSYLGLGEDKAREQYTDDPHCDAKDYPLPNLEKGDGNMVACQNAAVNLINNVHQVNQFGVGIPANMPFVAISGFYYTAQGIGMTGNTMTPDSLYIAASQFCQQSWGDLEKAHPKDKYLGNYCFNAPYMGALMTQGYRFPNDKSVTIENSINGNDIDWTLGAAIYALTNQS